MKKSIAKIFAIVIALYFPVKFSSARRLEDTSKKAKVHVITHSHMDAGWLFTYDDYFVWQVDDILRSVTKKLASDPKYTYTVGDIAYLRRFYNGCTKEEQNMVKQLIKNGQLEIVHGGMVQNDEATTNYSDILRNMEQAHNWLKNEL